MSKVKVSDLKRFAVRSLVKVGMTEKKARIVAETLVTTDMFGVMTHGTKNLCQYVQKMQAGGLDINAEPTVVAQGPSWAIVDGCNGIGMVTSDYAMRLAVKKAKKTGIAYVGVKNSCHFGAAGYYANIAARQGLLGLSMSNADPIMTVPNAAKPSLGTNPFSFAAPLKNGKTVFLDIALSNVAALKVIMAKEKGLSIPDTWLVDEFGEPTTDASKFPSSASLQPMGAHKGYGLAFLVEILTSIMTGAGIMHEVASWNLDMSSKNGAGHAFIAVDISKMMPYEEFEDRMENAVTQLKNTPLAKNATCVYLPGEIEWKKFDRANETDEIEVTDAMVKEYEKLSAMTGIRLKISK